MIYRYKSENMRLYDSNGKPIRNIIFIGDSYQKGTNNDLIGFVKYFQQWYGSEYGSIYTRHEGGYGFAREGYKFLTLLKDIETQIPNKNKITDIVCTSGYNDKFNLNGVSSAMSEFAYYARSQFPNADLWLAPVGWTRSYESSDRINIKDAIKNWVQWGPRTGFRVITNIACLFRDPSLLGSDKMHPNDEGQRLLARYMYVGLETGSVDITRESTNCGYIKNSKISNDGLTGMYSYDRNGLCTVTHAWKSKITFSSNITINCNGMSENLVDLGTLPNCKTHGYAWSGTSTLLTNGSWVNLAVKNGTSDNFVNVPAYVFILGGHIYLSCHKTPDTKAGYLSITTNTIQVPAFEFTVNNFYG